MRKKQVANHWQKRKQATFTLPHENGEWSCTEPFLIGWKTSLFSNENNKFNKNEAFTSASRVTRLPSGQIMWSTCDLTFSHDRSGVRKLPYKNIKHIKYSSMHDRVANR